MNTKTPYCFLIGDSVIDRYWVCDFDRLSPEGPRLLGNVVTTQDLMGGASYVERTLESIGCGVKLFSLQKCGPIDFHIKNRIVDRSYTSAGMRFDQKSTVTPENAADLFRNVRERVFYYLFDDLNSIVHNRSDVQPFIVISDYGKGTITQELYDMIIEEAKTRHVRVYCDPHISSVQMYRGADCVKVNKVEGSRLCDHDPAYIAHYLCCNQHNSIGLVTDGVNGIYGECALESYHVNGGNVLCSHIVDPIGAGDVVISAFAYAHELGADWKQSMEIARLCAEAMIQRIGTLYTLDQSVFDTHYTNVTNNRL